MINLLGLALKNVFRHRRDSVLIGLLICFGVGILILAGALERGMIEQMTDRIINVDTGHLLIKKADRQVDLPGESSNEITGPKINRALPQAGIELNGPVARFCTQDKHIERVCARILFSGMFYAGAQSTRALKIFGIEPGKEKIGSELTMVQGSYLNENDTTSIMLHQYVANSLALQVGDRLTVMCVMKGGGINALDFTLGGIFDNCAPWQSINSYIHLKSAQTLLNTPDRAMELVIFLQDPALSSLYASMLHTELNRFDHIKVSDWQQAGKFYLNQIQGTQSMIKMIDLLLVISIFGIIMNYMVMNVQRRTREMGILKALGTTPRQLVLIFLGEIAILSLIWIVIGLVISFIAVRGLAEMGLVASDAFSFLIGGKYLFPVWNWRQAVSISILFLTSTCLAGFFPVRRGIRIEITRAVHTIV
jgi:putative ABC transport system permease protein